MLSVDMFLILNKLRPLPLPCSGAGVVAVRSVSASDTSLPRACMCDTANGLCGAGKSCGVVGGVAERVEVSEGEVNARDGAADLTGVDRVDGFGLSPRAFLKRFLNPFVFSGDGAGALDWDRGDGRAVLVAEAIGPG